MAKTRQQLDQLTDEEIVEIVKMGKGDNVHLGIIYDRYKNRVYFKCISLLKNKKDAEDLSHDIFVKIFNKLNTFKGGSRFSLWVHSISFNTCITYLKDKKKRGLFEIDQTDESEIVYDTEELKEKEIKEFRLEQLERDMMELREEDRLLLLMKYFDGLSIDKMQQLTGLGASAIKMRLKRARERLYNIYLENNKALEDDL